MDQYNDFIGGGGGRCVNLWTCVSVQVCYLMPSSSPRCAQFPRAQDKVHFYIKLKELRDQIKGTALSHEVMETEYSFDLQLAKGTTVAQYPAQILVVAHLVCRKFAPL